MTDDKINKPHAVMRMFCMRLVLCYLIKNLYLPLSVLVIVLRP